MLFLPRSLPANVSVPRWENRFLIARFLRDEISLPRASNLAMSPTS